jgi:hypothetical protein
VSKSNDTNTDEAGDEVEHPSPNEKCLVIGSTGYTGVDSVEWDAGELPNIVDYDVIIVDVRALDEKMLGVVTHERFETLRLQITRLLHSSGRSIILTDYKKVHERPEQYPDRANNYEWCPITIGISNESGESIILKEKRFPRYIRHLNSWPYYFFIPRSCLSRQLTDIFGSIHNTKYSLPLSPFVENRYQKTIAGSFKIEITREQQKSSGYNAYNYYPDTPDTVTGEVVLLPLIEKLDHKEAVRLVLEDLIGVSMGYEPPSWVEPIAVPHVKDIEDEINEKESKIDEISSEIGKLENRREALNSYRRLLYSSGFDLEEIVKLCFEELGAKVTSAKYAQEEYVLEIDGTEYLVEVKGVSKSISLGHLRQLNDYILKYEEESGKACKGILFGNAWRATPPDNRDTAESPEFPANVVLRAEQWNIGLISSTKFFDAFCSFLRDRSKGEKILQDIVNTSGKVNFAIK